MAARKLLAVKGLSFSMRELAADAGVNLGLIHKHVGNKDDVVRAVLARSHEKSAAIVEGVASLPEAVRALFLVGVADPEYVRIVAWLNLHGRSDLIPNEDMDAFEAITRSSHVSVDDRVRQMAVLAAISGWSLFGSGILQSSEVPDDEREFYEARIANLLAAIIKGENDHGSP
ncbi:TetR family transcriptional regulator [Rhodococcus hoagii]|nr:TetR family transcriptional regulator [Prescottella equi]NKR42103.1 TetR family transcriptional regulator [Prescottella equi]NKR58827.1 TetR family transcriptional regulator [Prescottella equi]NKR69429.1 TetR family transcriptional regulator [Prescottella equi]NKR75031.1 TetR family transcriptional regulator [Prescottella equi]